MIIFPLPNTLSTPLTYPAVWNIFWSTLRAGGNTHYYQISQRREMSVIKWCWVGEDKTRKETQRVIAREVNWDVAAKLPSCICCGAWLSFGTSHQAPLADILRLLHLITGNMRPIVCFCFIFPVEFQCWISINPQYFAPDVFLSEFHQCLIGFPIANSDSFLTNTKI